MDPHWTWPSQVQRPLPSPKLQTQAELILIADLLCSDFDDKERTSSTAHLQRHLHPPLNPFVQCRSILHEEVLCPFLMDVRCLCWRGPMRTATAIAASWTLARGSTTICMAAFISPAPHLKAVMVVCTSSPLLSTVQLTSKH